MAATTTGRLRNTKVITGIAKKLVSLHLHPIAKLLRATLLNKNEERCDMCEIRCEIIVK